MKKLLIILGGIIALIIIAAFVAPMFIPTDTYKQQIAQQVRAATGRTLEIKGDISLSILPTASVTANDVTFSNAPGAPSPNMATLKSLEVEVKLWPLISGAIEIDRFVLVDPVINLEVTKAGRPNWVFESPSNGAKSPAKQPASPKPARKSSKPAAATPATGGTDLKGIRLGDVRIVNGTVRYKGAGGESYEVQKANFTVSLPDLGSQFNLTGDFGFNGQTVKIAAMVGNPSALMANGKTPLSLVITSQPISMSFKGSATGGTPPKVGGAISVSIPSIRKLAALAGSPLTLKGSGMGPFKLAGTLSVAGSTVSLSKAAIEIDQIKATGGVTIASAGSVPSIKGTLDVASLDLNPYIGQSGTTGSTKGADKGSAGSPKTSPGQAKSGWSTEKIDLAALRSVNADLKLKASGIRYQKIKVDRGALDIKLLGGRLTAKLGELVLYKGRGDGQLVVDASRPVLRIQQRFRLSNLEAEPFLRDAADTSRLSGRANISYEVAGAGENQRQIVAVLNGKGSIKFTDGAIRGFNIASMMRQVSTAALKSGFDSSQKTDFAVLGGTFVIVKGVLTNNDLLMQSPLVRLTGKGKVNLLARTQNYRVEPKVVGSLRGQGDKFDRKGIVVPIIVTGTWDNPIWRPDLVGALKLNSDGSLGSLKGLEKNYKGQAKDLLKGLTGKGTSGKAPADGDKSKGDTLKDQLKGLKGLIK